MIVNKGDSSNNLNFFEVKPFKAETIKNVYFFDFKGYFETKTV